MNNFPWVESRVGECASSEDYPTLMLPDCTGATERCLKEEYHGQDTSLNIDDHPQCRKGSPPKVYISQYLWESNELQLLKDLRIAMC